jgi:hypothetical protein
MWCLEDSGSLAMHQELRLRLCLFGESWMAPEAFGSDLICLEVAGGRSGESMSQWAYYIDMHNTFTTRYTCMNLVLH